MTSLRNREPSTRVMIVTAPMRSPLLLLRPPAITAMNACRCDDVILPHRTHRSPERRTQKDFQEDIEDQNDCQAEAEKPHLVMLLGKKILKRSGNPGQPKRA